VTRARDALLAALEGAEARLARQELPAEKLGWLEFPQLDRERIQGAGLAHHEGAALGGRSLRLMMMMVVMMMVVVVIVLLLLLLLLLARGGGGGRDRREDPGVLPELGDGWGAGLDTAEAVTREQRVSVGRGERRVNEPELGYGLGGGWG
jgi:hypothetical protein